MMFAGQGREELRRGFIAAWRKFRANEPLQPLEMQIAAVIAEHPEYHAWLEGGDILESEFTPERGHLNPFLHLGLHLALREQVATDRPAGISQLHARLTRNKSGAHEAEHAMAELLGEVLWESQRSGVPPDEGIYLERLRRLVSA
jgi:hypothetical protein